MNNTKGLTLISLMISISIVGILSTVGIPSLQQFMVQMKVDNEISRLQRLLTATRNFAITQQANVTVCPLVANTCSSNWDEELSVFIDRNNNGRFEPLSGDSLIQVKQAITTQDNLLYGVGRTAIMYNPQGRLNGWGQNGTFRYCPRGFLTLARGLRVAVSGRVYQTQDTDNDGKDEDRNNQELVCN